MTTDPKPLKKFGQNFLKDPGLLRWLADAFEPERGELIVEIGPGPGGLTRELAPRARRLIAIEIDERMLPGLAPLCEVELTDAAAISWDAFADMHDASSIRLIGNLPYNVGTVIVRHALESQRVSDAQFVLQKEVVDRLTAKPGTKAYGALTVITALRARAKKLRAISPGAFSPAPAVTSAVIRIEMREDAPLAAAEVPWLFGWLHRGFGQRRKQLLNTLGGDRDTMRALLEDLGYDAKVRAEAIAPEDWLELARRLEQNGPRADPAAS